jgi:hypothetical protein
MTGVVLGGVTGCVWEWVGVTDRRERFEIIWKNDLSAQKKVGR